MQVILQGSLRHFPLAELLPYVCRRTESGTLDIEAAGQRTRILFKTGKILWAESSKSSDALEAALEALDHVAGTFTLLDSAVLPENAHALDLDVQGLLDEAKRRAESAGFRDATLFRVVDDPALQQQVSLTSGAFKLLFRLSTGKTFRDLVTEIGVPRAELATRLRALLDLGLIAVVTEEPEPELTVIPKRTQSRRRTLVGSLTPDGAPDSVYPLLDAETTIGRAPENSIALADGSVSSHHARIVRTAEGFHLEDLQSRNGTFVNGERIVETCVLADGDLIRLGKLILTFNIARESKAGEPTTPELHLG